MKTFFKRGAKEVAEAAKIQRESRKPVVKYPYTPRFTNLTPIEKFKVDLFYSIRIAYREYIYITKANTDYKPDCIKDYLMPEIQKVMKQYGSALENLTESIKTANEILNMYDLGTNGEKGSYPLLFTTEIYDNIINNIKWN